MNQVRIAQKVVGPLATNCYILSCPDTLASIIVDPGGDPDVIIAFIGEMQLEPIEIVCTHGHSDHIAAVAPLCRHFGIGFSLHELDRRIVKLSVREAPLWGHRRIEEPVITRTIAAGDTIRLGKVSGTVLHTPGHTPGHVSLHFEGSVFVGDTIFAGSIGRTDLEGGDLEVLLDSIRRELLPLPDKTLVYCGHGPDTTIGGERHANPFINEFL
jgi:glyoxylase-like metal-dependent hydrolase (beta-lactamase superfamily II)